MRNDSTVHSIKTLNELIDDASTLPSECQDWLLTLAKAMAYTRKCIEEKLISMPDSQEQPQLQRTAI